MAVTFKITKMKPEITSRYWFVTSFGYRGLLTSPINKKGQAFAIFTSFLFGAIFVYLYVGGGKLLLRHFSNSQVALMLFSVVGAILVITQLIARSKTYSPPKATNSQDLKIDETSQQIITRRK